MKRTWTLCLKIVPCTRWWINLNAIGVFHTVPTSCSALLSLVCNGNGLWVWYISTKIILPFTTIGLNASDWLFKHAGHILTQGKKWLFLCKLCYGKSPKWQNTSIHECQHPMLWAMELPIESNSVIEMQPTQSCCYGVWCLLLVVINIPCLAWIRLNTMSESQRTMNEVNFCPQIEALWCIEWTT